MNSLRIRGLVNKLIADISSPSETIMHHFCEHSYEEMFTQLVNFNTV